MPNYGFTNTITTTSTSDPWGNWTRETSTAASNQIWWTWSGTSTVSLHHNGMAVAAPLIYTPATAQPFAPPFVHERRLDADAIAKARTLLEENLTPRQRRTWRDHGHFQVRCPSGRRYVVTKGQVGNVFELNDEQKRVHKYCIHPRGVPDEDAMLAQKLMLETDEESFLAIANRHW